MLIHTPLTLKPSQILEVDPCIFWAEKCPQPFIDSLQDLGQLQPVLVRKISAGYSLVAGYKRFQALKSLGRKIYALQVKDTGPWEKGLIYLSSNLTRMPDTLMMVRALRYFQPLGQDLQQICHLLGISRGSRQQKQLQAWITLPSAWDRTLEHNPQLLTCAPDLAGLNSEEQDLLLPFFLDLGWSLNNARNFLDLVIRAQKSRHTAIREMLLQLQLDRILAGDLSPKDKIRAILDNLGRAAYPNYFRLRDQARQNINSLVSGTLWNCIHADNFESPALELRVRVQNRDELHQAARQLSSIVDSEHMHTWPVYPHE
ncbi:ParB/RepB/Spo0J family partition protein [Desulfonatronospira sp.]|uniref:ParB/RepB/Spo0J family partition protein n=1 Tax=Desulfonatronospira sp. TaxID=1962951 RepID=UPI0025BF64B5|nr:ParB/RepB/Spo0J family partition protein [Desulfonatronospira sp.]